MGGLPRAIDILERMKVKDDRRLPFGLPGVNKDQESLQRQQSLRGDCRSLPLNSMGFHVSRESLPKLYQW
jgi:hypothetical protein